MYGTMKNKKRHMKSRRKDKRLMAKKKRSVIEDTDKETA